MSSLLDIKIYAFKDSGAVVISTCNSNEKLLTKESLNDDAALAHYIRRAIKLAKNEQSI